MSIDEQPGNDLPIARGAFWLFAPLATLVATCALVSLVERDWGVALAPHFAFPLEHYRALTYPLFGRALEAAALIPVMANAPTWAHDVVGLCLASGLSFTSWRVADATSKHPFWGLIFSTIAALVLGLLIPVLGAVLAFLFDWIPLPSLFSDDRDERTAALTLCSPVVTTASVLIANAFA